MRIQKEFSLQIGHLKSSNISEYHVWSSPPSPRGQEPFMYPVS